jgi:hypothetical protein
LGAQEIFAASAGVGRAEPTGDSLEQALLRSGEPYMFSFTVIS